VRRRPRGPRPPRRAGRLESGSLWLCVALNVVFVLGFEEHGPGAAVCTTTRFFDLGHFGKPFFLLAPWILGALGLLHAACSAARFASVCLQRASYFRVQLRRSAGDGEDGGGAEERAPEGAGGAGDAGDWRTWGVGVYQRVPVDGRVLFAALLLGSSLAALAESPFFFAVPLVDLLRSPTVLLLLRSVQHNANKLGQGGLVLLLLAYTHAILGYAWFGRHHQEGKCDNLFGCSMTYIVSGIKGNSIEDAMEDLTTPAALWVDLGAWARIGLDMSFHIIIPVILLSIISGARRPPFPPSAAPSFPLASPFLTPSCLPRLSSPVTCECMCLDVSPARPGASSCAAGMY
jgi:hypothetical protein